MKSLPTADVRLRVFAGVIVEHFRSAIPSAVLTASGSEGIISAIGICRAPLCRYKGNCLYLFIQKNLLLDTFTKHMQYDPACQQVA